MRLHRPLSARARAGARGSRRSDRGQSVVEFALIVPILFVLAIAIADFGRLFGAMIATEAAAREAADYGAFLGSPRWATTEAPWSANGTEMQRRACAAMSDQAGYANSAGTCSQNPAMTWELLDWNHNSNTYTPVGSTECGGRIGLTDPCVVHATVSFDFRPLIPLPQLLSILGGGNGGGGDTVTIVRDSWYAISDLSGT